MKSFIDWIYGFALAIGGPGLFTIAFLDSSFVSLPQINDLLVVLMVTGHKARMPYYAAMALMALGMVCLLLGARGGKDYGTPSEAVPLEL